MTHQENKDLAREFARSLDEEDYASTVACLAKSCLYEAQGETHRGVEAIIASYRSHGEWAATHLDQVRYESRVRAGGAGQVVVEFIDHVEHAGVAHTYRCEQVLAFDEEGLIREITHVELPGERERLDAFFRTVGITARS